jgi:uncharacterized circularly permuted ATP-grasp superfamily protein
MTMVQRATSSGTWNELIDEQNEPRQAAATLVQQINELGQHGLQARQSLADLEVRAMGITFTVYDDGQGIDRAWPFDIVPRIIAAAEWRQIEHGLAQRLKALNLFIDDLYNEQKVIADGVFPADLLTDSKNFRLECRGIRPKFGAWAHICGSDLVRDGDGTMYVLEDNLRVPSGQLHAGEPTRVQAGVRRPLPAPKHRTGRRVRGRAVQTALFPCPRRRD